MADDALDAGFIINAPRPNILRVAPPLISTPEELQPFVDEADLLLDIHSMSEPCRPLMVCGTVDKNAGNINKDPLFADPDNGDFHLKSKYGRYVAQGDDWVTDSVTSPCIDTGDPDEYPRAELTPNGNRINMGAYGGTPYASLSGWPPR